MANSNGDVNIRVAQRDDIDTIFEIRTSVVENYQSREEIAELGITPESVVKMLETDCCAWVAVMDDRPIGFSIANATEKTIFGVFVLPSFERQGIGRALMEAAESWLWSKGINEIWLVTGDDPGLRAYGFYMHLDWIPVGVESDGDFRGEMKFIKKSKKTTITPIRTD